MWFLWKWHQETAETLKCKPNKTVKLINLEHHDTSNPFYIMPTRRNRWNIYQEKQVRSSATGSAPATRGFHVKPHTNAMRMFTNRLGRSVFEYRVQDLICPDDTLITSHLQPERLTSYKPWQVQEIIVPDTDGRVTFFMWDSPKLGNSSSNLNKYISLKCKSL